jgi:hypothetical protein
MFLLETKRNYFLISGKNWRINKATKNSFHAYFIEKKRKCILQVPPYKSPLFRINHIWSFFLKIKGYLVQLNISKEAGLNKIKFLSTLKNIFEINSLKIQKNLEFINFRQEKNLFVNFFIKSREFFIFKEPPFFSSYFWNLNSGSVCTSNLKYNNKEMSLLVRRKTAILSTW